MLEEEKNENVQDTAEEVVEETVAEEVSVDEEERKNGGNKMETRNTKEYIFRLYRIGKHYFARNGYRN